MALRPKIHECLSADSRVSALIGASPATRHYPERAPQGVASPYVVSSEIAGDAHTTHGLPDDPEDTMDETLVQFTCLAATAAEAIALRLAIRQALLEDASDILRDANIVATAPVTRFLTADEVDLHGAQLDVTFFHNPQT